MVQPPIISSSLKTWDRLGAHLIWEWVVMVKIPGSKCRNAAGWCWHWHLAFWLHQEPYQYVSACLDDANTCLQRSLVWNFHIRKSEVVIPSPGSTSKYLRVLNLAKVSGPISLRPRCELGYFQNASPPPFSNMWPELWPTGLKDPCGSVAMAGQVVHQIRTPN